MTKAAKRSRSLISLAAGLVLLAGTAWGQPDLSGALARVSDSVFTIKTDKGLGTGFVVSPGGEALTCRHVVADASQLSITLADGSTTTAEVVASDPDRDLALLKLERTGLPSVTFGSSDDLKAGADVAAVGAPLGLENSVTKGVVSNPSREINGKHYLQISAQLNPGNSGGPVINAKGEVVGIANAIIKEANGVGFAIPSSVALEFLAAQKVSVATALGVKPASAPSAVEAPSAPPPPPTARELAAAIWPLLAGVVLISLLLSILVSSIIARGAVRRLGGGGSLAPPPAAPWGQPAPPAAPPVQDLSDIDITLQ
jgi:hypothetical protein